MTPLRFLIAFAWMVMGAWFFHLAMAGLTRPTSAVSPEAAPPAAPEA